MGKAARPISPETEVTMSEAFAWRLKIARKQKGLTQNELGRLLGVKSEVTVSRWERGFIPPLHVIQEIADKLDKPVYWFLMGPGVIGVVSATQVALEAEDLRRELDTGRGRKLKNPRKRITRAGNIMCNAAA